MREKVERALSYALTCAAIAIAVTLVHREFFVKAQRASTPQKPPERVTQWSRILEAGRRSGPAAAKVSILEMGDLECPYCARFERAYQKVKSEMGDDVALVFVHLPLESHRFALPAARALECGAAQGQLETMRETLYAKQDSFGLKSWVDFAVEAGVRDTARFARCSSNGEAMPTVEKGIRLAQDLNIHATPSVFINGWRFYVPPNDTLLRKVALAARAGDDSLAALIKLLP